MSGELVHGPDCPCTRCRGFEPGHELSKTHGAYSEREIGPLREAILEHLARVSPLPAEADDHARRVLAGRLARIEVAQRWIHEHGVCDADGELRPIVRELAKWEAGLQTMLRELGLTTSSRVDLGLGIAQTHVAIAEVQGVISAVFLAAGRFVPEDCRAEFRSELDRLLAGLPVDAAGLGSGDA